MFDEMALSQKLMFDTKMDTVVIKKKTMETNKKLFHKSTIKTNQLKFIVKEITVPQEIS